MQPGADDFNYIYNPQPPPAPAPAFPQPGNLPPTPEEQYHTRLTQLETDLQPFLNGQLNAVGSHGNLAQNHASMYAGAQDLGLNADFDPVLRNDIHSDETRNLRNSAIHYAHQQDQLARQPQDQRMYSARLPGLNFDVTSEIINHLPRPRNFNPNRTRLDRMLARERSLINHSEGRIQEGQPGGGMHVYG